MRAPPIIRLGAGGTLPRCDSGDAMEFPQAPRPDHELNFEGSAPWPVSALPNAGGDWTDLALARDPAARCCRDCGRKLLLLLLGSSTWVSHRSEHVSFRDELSVLRRVTIECHVPKLAPVFRDQDGQLYRLVPLSLLRRQTLIQFELRDEDGRSVFRPSLFQSQAITESVLLACADATLEAAGSGTRTDIASGPEIADFVHQVVSGDQLVLRTAYESLKDGTAKPAVLNLAGQRMFRGLLDRLADNFVLWVMMPADTPQRRVLTFSYAAPIQPSYQTVVPDRYPPSKKLGPWHPSVWSSALGLTATRIRFPVPAADSTASYHFEVDVPKGVQIVEASLLAGDPGNEMPSFYPPSFDHVRGGFPAVGLNVIEVPYGSLSRAQISLQVAARGWLATSMLSCWIVFGLLLGFATHHGDLTRAGGLPVVILVALAGWVAGIIAQFNAQGLAAYLVRWARIFATIAAVLPLATAYIAFEGVQPNQVALVLWVAVGVSCFIAIILSAACLASWRRQRWYVPSPWEQNRARKDIPRGQETFKAAARKCHYDRPAMRVDSVEGWQTEFFWNADTVSQLIANLRMK